MTTIEIAGVNQALREVASGTAWFYDEQRNWEMGWGRGDYGVLHAFQTFRRDLERSEAESDFGVLGIYRETEPVGYVSLRYLSPESRTVEMVLYLAEQDKDLMETSLQQITDHVFTVMRKKVQRLEVDFFQHSPWIKTFREFGFTQEGIRKNAVWHGNIPYNVIPLRLLRPDWVRMQEN